MDVSEATAAEVAARVSARATTSVDDLLRDDTVDVVAVCSPHQFHAEQVIAACRAGKRAVLCEKPFATTTDEASRIAQVSVETGVPIIVGAMHTYDPGWVAFTEAWGPTRGSATHIRCSAVLPPNPRFEDFATEVTNRQPPQAPSPSAAVDDRANRLRGGILGLAIHDLPLIRAFLTATDRIVVHAAQTLTPFGYLVVFSCGEQVVELHAHMSANWSPSWLFEVFSGDRVGSVNFTPSYVQAGSAEAVHQLSRAAGAPRAQRPERVRRGMATPVRPRSRPGASLFSGGSDRRSDLRPRPLRAGGHRVGEQSRTGRCPMTALRVSAATDAEVAGDIVTVIASLPISLVGAESGTRGELVAVHGGPGWPERTAECLLHHVRGLLIVHPTPVSTNQVPDVVSVPVVVDYRFAGNPALAAAAEAFVGWPAGAMIEVAAVVPDASSLDETLVDQLATLRRLGQPAVELHRLTWNGSGYYLRGSTTAGSPVLVSAHVSSGARPSLRVRGLAADSGVVLTLPDPGTARPAVLVNTTSTGATTTPTIWETSHRAAWRRLHAAVTGARLTNDLADLRADLTIAGQALPTR